MTMMGRLEVQVSVRSCLCAEEVLDGLPEYGRAERRGMGSAGDDFHIFP